MGQLIFLFFYFLCVLVHNSISQVEYSISTDPQRQPGDSEIYVIDYEDAANVSIYCAITSTQDDNTMDRTSEWRLINGSTTTQLSLFNGNVSADFPFISFSDNLRRVLIISSFNSDINGIQLKCSLGNVSATFLYRFRVDVALESPSESVKRVENTTFTINLFSSDAEMPFPPISSSTWTRDGQAISDDNIEFTNYNITFNNVLRSQAGLYEQNVSNTLSSANATFSLDVLYFPVGQRGPSLVYARLGDNITLTAFDDIIANPPVEVFIWSKPPIDNISIEGRFSAPSLGQLRITNITMNDEGVYDFFMTNGVGRNGTVANVDNLIMSMQNNSIIFFNFAVIQLIIAMPPGNARNVTYNVIGTIVEIQWREPIDAGQPDDITYYVIVTHSGTNAVLEYATTNTTIILPCRDINSSTNYTFIIASTNRFYTDVNTASSSNKFGFTTGTAVPDIKSITATSNDGMIVVSSIISNSTVANDTIAVQVMCNEVGLMDSLVSNCPSSCLDDNLSTTTTLGPITAETTYQCAVTIMTMCGSNTLNSGKFNTSEGIPSAPMISVEVSTSGVIITFQTNPGTTSTGTLNISVVITTSDGTVVHNQTYTISNYIANSEREISITGLPPGELTVMIIARNIYGSSSAAVMQIDNINNDPDPTSNPTEVIVDTTLTGIIVGCVVAGVVVIVVVFAIVLLIGAIVRRRGQRDKNNEIAMKRVK